MIPKIFIETERLYLRQWQPDDEAAYITINNDEKVIKFFPTTLTAEQSLQHIGYITEHITKVGYGLFAFEKKEDHFFIGITGISHPAFDASFTPCMEIGWRLATSSWNRGFATEAAKACLVYGFKRLAFKDVCSFTAVQNAKSDQVKKKIGMQKAGEFDHPLQQKGHSLQKHVLYKIVN